MGRKVYIGLDKPTFFEHKIVNIFLPISFKICFVCSKEPPQWDGSFEYPQHMFLVETKENLFLGSAEGMSVYIQICLLTLPLLVARSATDLDPNCLTL